MEIAKDTLAKMRDELPRGGQIRVAERAKYSDQYVSDFLNGKVIINKDNIKIFYECQKEIRDHREFEMKAKAAIENENLKK